MFELSVEARFSAAHAVTIKGVLEPLHGHDFHVTLTVAADALDADGFVCDFHAVEAALRRVIEPWHNSNLNDQPAFAREKPSAERIARHIALQTAPAIPAPARLVSVRVTEAPGCAATYRP